MTLHIDGLMVERSNMMRENSTLKTSLKKVSSAEDERARSMQGMEAEMTSLKAEILILNDKLKQKDGVISSAKLEGQDSLRRLNAAKSKTEDLTQVNNVLFTNSFVKAHYFW